MSESAKFQPFTYSLRSVAVVLDDICNRRFYLYITPPEDALTIENLRCHLKIQFDAGIASGSRKVENIGIMNASQDPLSVTANGSYTRMHNVNLTADASRIVDLTIDLSSLLNKTDVGYQGQFDSNVVNRTLVFFDLPLELLGTTNIGDILLWHIDALFTTKGIR